MGDPFARVGSIIDAQHRATVMQDTWGHLYPPVGEHKATIRVAGGEYAYAARVVLSAVHPTLENSPWLAQAIVEFGCADDIPPGEVREWVGKIRCRKNGRIVIAGGKWSTVLHGPI